MSETKFTPGPWAWDETNWRKIDAGGTVFSEDGKNAHVEKFMDLQLQAGKIPVIPIRIDHYTVIYDGNPISPANRALIAAAPDLYAALEAMADKAGNQNWNDNYPEQLAAAFAALDKALGQS